MPPGAPGAFAGAQRNEGWPNEGWRNEGWRGEGWRGEDWRSRAKNSDTYEWTSRWGRRPAGPEAEVSSQFGRSRSPVEEGDFADTLGRLVSAKPKELRLRVQTFAVRNGMESANGFQSVHRSRRQSPMPAPVFFPRWCCKDYT